MNESEKKKDRSADMKLLEDCISKQDQIELEKARLQVFLETSKAKYEAWENYKPAPYWGTGRNS